MRADRIFSAEETQDAERMDENPHALSNRLRAGIFRLRSLSEVGDLCNVCESQQIAWILRFAQDDRLE